MKIKNAVIILGFFSGMALAGRGDAICDTWLKEGYGNKITTPAITGDIQDKPADLAICFQGKDFSQQIAKSALFKKLPGNGLRVVSSSNVDGFREMYVSLYNSDSGESVITRVVVNEQNNIEAYPGGLVSRQQIKNSDPEGQFMFIPSYRTDAVYFNFVEPTKSSIYYFHHTPGYPNSAADLAKVSDGYGEWIKKNGDIIVSKDKIVEGHGREVYGFIIKPDGSEKCKVDASQSAWVLSALTACQ
ncbi:TPA: hypothetical protein ACIJ1F_003706 [Citrobacter freundii]|nr:hypothetical protein [Citrobacter freundii]